MGQYWDGKQRRTTEGSETGKSRLRSHFSHSSLGGNTEIAIITNSCQWCSQQVTEWKKRGHTRKHTRHNWTRTRTPTGVFGATFCVGCSGVCACVCPGVVWVSACEIGGWLRWHSPNGIGKADVQRCMFWESQPGTKTIPRAPRPAPSQAKQEPKRPTALEGTTQVRNNFFKQEGR